MTVPVDLTSLSWALAAAREMLRDTIEPHSYSDSLLMLALGAHAIEHEDSTYYRPHAAAANTLLSDPERLRSETIDNATKSFMNPAHAASALLRAYAWIDDQIEDATGTDPRPSRTLRVVF